MISKDQLIGKWSIDVMYGPGAQEDTWLVFFHDGTGWIEYAHYILIELETFNWELDSNGNITINGVLFYRCDSVEESHRKFENIVIDMNYELTPSGKTMEVITFTNPIWYDECKFGLITRDVLSEKMPKFG